MGRFPASLKPLNAQDHSKVLKAEQARAALAAASNQFYGHRQYLQLLK